VPRVTRVIVVAVLGALVAVGCSSGSGSADKAGTKKPAQARVTETSLIADTGPQPGAVRQHYKFGPVEVKAGQNNIAYSFAGIPKPAVDGWIVRIAPNLTYENGTVPPVDVIHLHHGVWLNMSATDATTGGRLPERFFAVGEEKTVMLLPQGYGYRYKANDRWLLNYMLHNLTSKPDKVFITYDIDIIPSTAPAAASVKPARPIWMDVENGSVYPVFDVHKGSGQDGKYTYPDDATDPYTGRRGRSGPRNEWTVDKDGVLLVTAGHLHPGGLQTDMYVQRSGATALKGHDKPGKPDTAHLFTSVAHYYEPAGPASWDVSMTGTPADWRVQVRKGDKLSINTTYDSGRASWFESMGIMVAWMADGTDGADPFTTAVDKPGVLTHGHLAENDNHGGKPAPDAYVDATKLPSQPPADTIVIDNFVYAKGDITVANSIPTVEQGKSIRFVNNDAPLGNGIWHTITSCQAPCNLSNGIAYPIADAAIQFDSGELGKGGAPTANRVDWSTPTDLAPGTYTYFCRIHPFMRGAFRVVPKA
jgi:plastocyanin